MVKRRKGYQNSFANGDERMCLVFWFGANEISLQMYETYGCVEFVLL